jgi:hypothetical protein
MKSTNVTKLSIKRKIAIPTARGDHAYVYIEHKTNRILYVYGDSDIGFCFDTFAEVGKLFQSYYRAWREQNLPRIKTFNSNGEFYEYLD